RHGAGEERGRKARQETRGQQALREGKAGSRQATRRPGQENGPHGAAKRQGRSTQETAPGRQARRRGSSARTRPVEERQREAQGFAKARAKTRAVPEVPQVG